MAGSAILVIVALAGGTAGGTAGAGHATAHARVAAGTDPRAPNRPAARAARATDAIADAAHAFAVDLAAAGPRPAGSTAERAGQRAAAAEFRAAGLAVSHDRFAVPGKGTSRNVVAKRPGSSRCLRILVAHADSTPTSPGALDNASGVGLLVALARPVAADRPRCETWLVATGAEERLYTGRPDHLGASALVRRLRRERRTRDVRWALSLDEVGAGSSFDLYSPARRARAGVERPVLDAARAEGVRVRRVRDGGTGNSDHREIELAGMPGMKLGVVTHACRHTACDRPGQLRKGAFRRTTAVVVRLLGLEVARPAAAASFSDPHHDTPARPAEAR